MTTEMYQRVAERVRLLRKSRGWRQEDLASQLGWSRGSVAHIEQGRRRLFLEDALHLASTLGVGLGDLHQGESK